MKSINISLLVILSLFGSCNTERTSSQYCNFSYPAMRLDSLCMGKLNVKAHYENKELKGLKFFSKGNLIQEDTIIRSKGEAFYISHYTIGTVNLTRVTTVRNDTTRTFVFSGDSINYDLMFTETAVSDSSVLIQFALPRTFITYDFDLPFVVKLQEEYMNLNYSLIYLQIEYVYSHDSLKYEVLEFVPEIRGHGRNSQETIFNHYNCMYLDIISIEDRTLLFLSKQLRTNY